MRILINHLTRMKPGFVCIAGINRYGQHIRPVAGRLARAIVSVEGGPVDLGVVLDIGDVTNAGAPPEVEDRAFVPAAARAIKSLRGDEFWSANDAAAKSTLRGIFGNDLQQHGSGATVDKGCGSASLGVLRPQGRVQLHRSGFGAGLRVSLEDVDLGPLNLSLTDLRYVDAKHQAPNEDALDEATARLGDGEPVLLSVGLARAFMARNDDKERHWLQVNNLHFRQHADWSLAKP